MVRIFGVTGGFLEDLEKRGTISPGTFMIGKVPYKMYSAKDVRKIRDTAVASTYKSTRIRGREMAKVLSVRG